MSARPRLVPILLLGPSALLAACASGPLRERAPLDLPGRYAFGTLPATGGDASLGEGGRGERERTVLGGPSLPAGLWKRFACDELDALVAAATRDGFDTGEARARTAGADAAAEVARAPLYPNLGADADLLYQSANSRSLGSVDGAFLDLGLTGGYELDVWGKNRGRATAAEARYQASRFEQASVALAVTAQVVDTFLQLLSSRERLAIARDNLVLTGRVLEVVEARLRAGVALQSDVSQQRALVASEESQAEALAQQEAETRVSLAFVLGRAPAGFDVQAGNLDAVREPKLDAGDVGDPAKLLGQRPDVAQAEAVLAATGADVRAAKAALLPRAQLTGQAAFQSVFLSPEVSGSGVVYTALATLTQPIFDGGQRTGERDAALARRDEATFAYRRVATLALAEVEKALRALDGVEKQRAALAHVVDEARRAFELIEVQYKAGTEDLLSVLDAQRTLARARDDFSRTRLAKLRAVVALFKALGAPPT